MALRLFKNKKKVFVTISSILLSVYLIVKYDCILMPKMYTKTTAERDLYELSVLIGDSIPQHFFNNKSLNNSLVRITKLSKLLSQFQIAKFNVMKPSLSLELLRRKLLEEAKELDWFMKTELQNSSINYKRILSFSRSIISKLSIDPFES